MADFTVALARLEAFLAQEMADAAIPGLSLALTDRRQMFHGSTHGFANLDARQAVTAETLFEIGSIGKSFTSAVLLQLQELGQIDVQAPVSRYLPWFDVPSGYDPIAIHHLMSHTAGIIAGTDAAPDSAYPLWALRQMPVAAPPGDYFHYSNLGYKLLSVLLETVLGQPYGQIIQTRLLDPLGMASTAPVITHEWRNRMAVGYEPFYDDRPWHPSLPLAPATWVEYGQGDGSLVSHASDMTRWLRLWLNEGSGEKGPLLSPQSFAFMRQPVIAAGMANYGHGLFVHEVDGVHYLGHGGSMVGYRSMALVDQDHGLGVVVLVNGPADTYRIGLYALQLLQAALQEKEMPSFPRRQRTRLENAGEYAGIYRDPAGNRALRLEARQEQLILNGHTPLEQREKNVFYVPHPGFDRYLLYFGPEEPPYREICFGPGWYVKDGYRGPTSFEVPAEWQAYPGHYRAHNPWQSNFRVFLRKGQLVLAYAAGFESPLTWLDNERFRVGEATSPETIQFDTVINGQAQRAIFSDGHYYRFFTP